MELLNEEQIKENGGRNPVSYARSHTNYFWAKFGGLLEIAESKGGLTNMEKEDVSFLMDASDLYFSSFSNGPYSNLLKGKDESELSEISEEEKEELVAELKETLGNVITLFKTLLFFEISLRRNNRRQLDSMEPIFTKLGDGLMSFAALAKENLKEHQQLMEENGMLPFNIEFVAEDNSGKFDYLIFQNVDPQFSSLLNDASIPPQKISPILINSAEDSEGVVPNYKLKADFSIDDFTPVDEEGNQISIDPNVMKNAKYYSAFGINIFDPNDAAFTDKCFNLELKKYDFDYDLTQKYLVKNILSDYKIIGFTCGKGFATKSEGGYYICENNPGDLIDFTGKLVVSNSLYKEPNYKNPVLRCMKHISDLKENIGLWFFLSIFIVFILLITLLFLIQRRANKKISAVANDFMLSGAQIIPATTVIATKSNEDIPKIQMEGKIESTGFVNTLIRNIFQLHPVLRLFYSSILNPQYVSALLLFANICSLFGFNSYYFTYQMAKNLVEDSQRKNFAYPMKEEYFRIMASIAFTCGVTLILKRINMISYEKKIELSESIEKSNIEKISEDFNKEMRGRRILLVALCFALNIWTWIYSIGFCGYYFNSQYNWFYTGIWSVFWNWIIYSNIFIIIISAIEYYNKKGENSKAVYYLKSLFIF